MKISECMSRDVQMLSPDNTVMDAARMMAECDIGLVPIANNDRLVGMVTDRDIVVRGICQGKDASSKLSEVMTGEVLYCYEDEDTEHVARNMSDMQVRRLPVMNRDKRLVGIVAIGDLARGRDNEMVGRTMQGISQPGGRHDQSAARH